MIERRKYLRIREEDLITCEVLPSHKIGKGLTENLSIGGIRFFIEEFIPIASILRVELKLKHADREINAIVKVKWVRQVFSDEQYDVGAEFIDISSEDIKFLNNYLYKRAKGTD